MSSVSSADICANWRAWSSLGSDRLEGKGESGNLIFATLANALLPSGFSALLPSPRLLIRYSTKAISYVGT